MGRRKAFSCPFCLNRYTTSPRLEKHISEKHPEQYLILHQQDEDGANTAWEGLTQAHPNPFSEGGSDDEHEDPEPMDQSRIEYYLDAGRPIPQAVTQDTILSLDNMFYPFNSLHEFELANWFVREGTTKTGITTFFQSNLSLSASEPSFFSSGHTLWQKIKQMADYDYVDLEYTEAFIDMKIPDVNPIPYLHRDPVGLIKHLLKQPAYADSLVYGPIRQYNSRGERMYSEIHTADWWWEEQEKIPRGGTVVPLICASDSTHLTNFSGDKKAWPIYLTIANLPSTVRNKPSYAPWMTLALLPQAPKKKDLPAEYKLTVTKHIQEVIFNILSPLIDAISPKCNNERPFLDLVCADGKFRRCYPTLCGWIADHVEYAELLNISYTSCPICEIDVHCLGNWKPEAPERDYVAYERLKLQVVDETLSARDRKRIRKELQTRYKVHETPIAFCQLPGVRPSLLPKPDLLHGIYLGTLKMLLGWVHAEVKEAGRLAEFDKAWLSLMPYPRFSQFNRPPSQITQWQGKELRAAGRILNSVLAVALRPTPADRSRVSNWQKVQKCVRNFLEFHLLAQYKSHTSETIEYMETYWQKFHEYKDCFLKYRNQGRKKRLTQTFQRAIADAQSRIHIESRGLSSAQKAALFKQQREELEKQYHEKEASLNSFNTVKIHQPSHYSDAIRRFGHLGGWSTDAPELNHTDLKRGYRASNRKDFNRQILEYQSRRRLFQMRQLNILALGQQSDVNFQKVVSDFPRLAKVIQKGTQGLSQQAIIAEEDQVPSQQKSKENRIVDSRTQESEEVEDSLPDAQCLLKARHWLKGSVQKLDVNQPWTVGLCMNEYEIPNLDRLLYRYFKVGFWDTAVRQGRLPACPGEDTDVDKWKCQPFNQLLVLVPDFTEPDEDVKHPIRCTGKSSFGGRNERPRKDFLFIDKNFEHPGRPQRQTRLYGALQGQIPARAELILRIKDPYLQQEHELICITELKPVDNGKPQDPHGLVRVYSQRNLDAEQPEPSDTVDWPDRCIVAKEEVISLAHLVREGNSSYYFVNSHIDLTTYNTFYLLDEA